MKLDLVWGNKKVGDLDFCMKSDNFSLDSLQPM